MLSSIYVKIEVYNSGVEMSEAKNAEPIYVFEGYGAENKEDRTYMLD